MGIRGEIFSTKVQLQNRTYFFNVKENRMGNLYLNIVESKNKEGGGFDRASLVLFEEDTQIFLKSFDDALRVMEKTLREKRRKTREQDREREAKPRAEGEGSAKAARGPRKPRVEGEARFKRRSAPPDGRRSS
jgi:hypothetical protein